MSETTAEIIDAINQTHFPGPLGPRTFLTRQEALDTLLPLASDAPKPEPEPPADEQPTEAASEAPAPARRGRPRKVADEQPTEAE